MIDLLKDTIRGSANYQEITGCRLCALFQITKTNKTQSKIKRLGNLYPGRCPVSDGIKNVLVPKQKYKH